MRRLVWLIIIISLVLDQTVYAIQGDAGGAGGFLKLGSGVRALSMGGAFVGLADDASASYWNPAGLTQIKGGEISLMYAEPFGKVAGITHQNIAYALETKNFNYGFNFIYAGVEGIEGYDASANSTGNFGSSEWAALLSVAYPPSPYFSWGTSFKLVSQQIDDHQAKGIGADLGMLLKGDSALQVGLNLENIIPPTVKLRDTLETYPRKARYGIMFPYVLRNRYSFTITADQISQDNTTPKQHYGLETGLFQKIFIRGGYNTASFEQSYGFGLRIAQFGLDYAYLLHPYLGDTHRAGLVFKF